MSIYVEKTDKATPTQGNILNSPSSMSETDALSIKSTINAITPPLNKLINGDFLSNQRGLSSYTLSVNNSMYTLDMWFIYAAQDSTIKVTKKSNSILIETTGLETQFQQIFDILTGKYTISTKIISINGNVKLSKYNNGFTDVKTDLKVGVNNILFDSTFNRIAFRFSGACSLELEYVDLFEGDIAYPHVKEDYAIALMRCRRFLKVYNTYVTSGIIYGNTVHVTLQMDIDFFGSPTVIIQNLKAIVDGFESHEIRYVDFIGFDGTCAFLTFITEGSGFSTSLYGHTARIYGTLSNSKMIISCEPL